MSDNHSKPETSPDHVDRRSASLLFAYGFGNAAAYVIARTIADSQFLSRIGPGELPKVYLAAAGVVALASAIYGKLVRGASVRGAVITTLGILSAATAVLPFVVHAFPVSPIAMTAVYLLAQVRGSLGTIQFTMLLNEQFAQRQPERVVGVLGIGSTLAGFSLGIALGQFLDVSDLPSLLYAVAGIDLLTMIPVKMLPPGRKFGAVSANQLLRSKTAKGNQPHGRPGRYPIQIAVMVAFAVLAMTLVEYQWKVTVANQLHRSEADLAKYFGTFYGCVFLVTGVMQFFVTAPILERRGVITGLVMFPFALLFSSVGIMLAAPGRMLLWAVTLAKGCDALKRSLNDPAVHILYSPLPSELRHQVVTWVSGIIKPLTEAFASVLLIVFAADLSTSQLSVIVIAVVAIWLALDVLVWRGFEVERRRIQKCQDLDAS